MSSNSRNSYAIISELEKIYAHLQVYTHVCSDVADNRRIYKHARESARILLTQCITNRATLDEIINGYLGLFKQDNTPYACKLDVLKRRIAHAVDLVQARRLVLQDAVIRTRPLRKVQQSLAGEDNANQSSAKGLLSKIIALLSELGTCLPKTRPSVITGKPIAVRLTDDDIKLISAAIRRELPQVEDAELADYLASECQQPPIRLSEAILLHNDVLLQSRRKSCYPLDRLYALKGKDAHTHMQHLLGEIAAATPGGRQEEMKEIVMQWLTGIGFPPRILRNAISSLSAGRKVRLTHSFLYSFALAVSSIREPDNPYPELARIIKEMEQMLGETVLSSKSIIPWIIGTLYRVKYALTPDEVMLAFKDEFKKRDYMCSTLYRTTKMGFLASSHIAVARNREDRRKQVIVFFIVKSQEEKLKRRIAEAKKRNNREQEQLHYARQQPSR